ncbi:MAG: sensor histidine kinase [Gemmatimonadaceae bacterium]
MTSADALAAYLAARLRGGRETIVARWLERIAARVNLSPNNVFPTDELLNHVPLLVDGIADYLVEPTGEIGTTAPVVAKAMELGALRHAQGFDAHEIMKEHEILAAVIFTFIEDDLDDETVPGTRRDFAECWQRVSFAVEAIRQATMNHFMRLWSERVNEREGRLRQFNRMVSHELKNRVGAIKGASSLLAEPWIENEQRERFVTMISENATNLQRVLSDLEALSRIDTDTRQRRNVMLPQAASEAVRQLREPAGARQVTVTISDDLPNVEVDAAAVELALVNYVSNAIKYSDPEKDERRVAITAELVFGQLIVRTTDNGIGVPPAARPQLFEQFFRAHLDTVTVDGTGLGLSIVRETVDAMGGRAWAEFPESGETVFAFSLPSRRAEDAAAAGTKRSE